MIDIPELDLYEKKMLQDGELPVQIDHNLRSTPREIFFNHWHEHIEIHYIVEGEADFHLGQNHFHARPGDIIIANRNEPHTGWCTKAPYHAWVIIFDVQDLSGEMAQKNYLFHSFIRGETVMYDLIRRIMEEKDARAFGYKQMCRALVLELLVWLSRNHVAQSLPQKESNKQRKDLQRLHTVLQYLGNHYDEKITVRELADIACLSEDRFGHLFRECIGQPPLQYINEMRLRKAMSLLRTNEYSVTEVAAAVGFRDYNHFGRQFHKLFGCTPSEAKRTGSDEENIAESYEKLSESDL